MQCHVGLYFLSNSFLIYAAMSCVSIRDKKSYVLIELLQFIGSSQDQVSKGAFVLHDGEINRLKSIQVLYWIIKSTLCSHSHLITKKGRREYICMIQLR
jgi:hypothetical protein